MMDQDLRILAEIVTAAGRRAHEHFRKLERQDIQHKSAVDMVTRVDGEVEAFLRDQLGKAYPGVGFYGEEGDYGRLADFDDVFIVDPLDGTTSFIHGHPFYSVSLGLRRDGQLELGLVFLPYFGQLYYARRGAGAFRDGEPIRVSATSELIDSLAATGFACVRARHERNNLPLFNDIMPRIRGIRRCGSAAIDLCYVAEGIYDLYWEYDLRPWDIAAGTLIVTEAGGQVSDFSGGQDFERSHQFVASNGMVHPAFLAVATPYADPGSRVQ